MRKSIVPAGENLTAAAISENAAGSPADRPITASMLDMSDRATNARVSSTVASGSGRLARPSPAVPITQPSAVVASATTVMLQMSTPPAAESASNPTLLRSLASACSLRNA